jgi:ABC-2 type transport system ATP-binding protein
VQGLTKRFGAVTALAGIDLSVAPGEVVTLLGPNGAGKSTLIRILATTVLPDEGSVHVAGYDAVAQPTAVRRSFGLALGDERSWYWRLSGRRNLEFFAALYGLRRREAAARVDVLLREIGLADAADRRFDGYSTGMRMRLSLARALLPDPRVLLLDEPTRSLDPLAASAFQARVLELASARRMAVLYATHDLHEAAEIASRVLILVRGRVAATLAGGSDAAALERSLLVAAA